MERLECFHFFCKLANKGSKNRSTETMQTIVIQVVDQTKIRKLLINNMLPSICEHWPRALPELNSKKILLQEKNAKRYTLLDDLALTEKLSADGQDIQIIWQPHNSSDINVLDLGFSQSI